MGALKVIRSRGPDTVSMIASQKAVNFQLYAPAAFHPEEDILVFISLRG